MKLLEREWLKLCAMDSMLNWEELGKKVTDWENTKQKQSGKSKQARN